MTQKFLPLYGYVFTIFTEQSRVKNILRLRTSTLHVKTPRVWLISDIKTQQINRFYMYCLYLSRKADKFCITWCTLLSESIW